MVAGHFSIFVTLLTIVVNENGPALLVPFHLIGSYVGMLGFKLDFNRFDLG